MILSTVDVTMIAEGLAEKSRELCHFGNSHFLSTPNGIEGRVGLGLHTIGRMVLDFDCCDAVRELEGTLKS